MTGELPIFIYYVVSLQ